MSAPYRPRCHDRVRISSAAAERAALAAGYPGPRGPLYGTVHALTLKGDAAHVAADDKLLYEVPFEDLTPAPAWASDPWADSPNQSA